MENGRVLLIMADYLSVSAMIGQFDDGRGTPTTPQRLCVSTVVVFSCFLPIIVV